MSLMILTDLNVPDWVIMLLLCSGFSSGQFLLTWLFRVRVDVPLKIQLSAATCLDVLSTVSSYGATNTAEKCPNSLLK